MILWQRDGVSPSYTIHFNARAQQVVSLSQIAALHIDNTQCSSTINIVFPDTQFQLQLGPNSEGFYPVVTNSLEFYAYIDLAPTVNDRSVIQVLNFLPPPIEFGSAGGQGVGAGTVRQVDTVAPLQGGPITDQGTLSLAVPLPLNIGGTGAITANAALDNLSNTSGTTAGSLSRSAGGNWTVSAGAGSGTISAVNPGTGITGGGTSGAVTVGLQVPVTVANGGTGATTAAQALTNLAAAPLAAPAFTGAPTAPTAAPGTNTTQLATTAFVTAATLTAGGAYVPLTGAVPMSGRLDISQNGTIPAAAGSLFHVTPNNGASGLAVIDTFAGINTFPTLKFRKSEGSAAAPSALLINDVIGDVIFEGYDGAGYQLGGQIYATTIEPWSATARGSAIIFSTVNPGTTVVNVPLVLGRGLMVNTPLAQDPGVGSMALSGGVTAAGNFICSTNGGGLNGKNISNITVNIISVNASNQVAIGFDTVNISQGSFLPSGNNLQLCGNTGNGWSNVVAYALTNISDLRDKTDIAELPACLDLVQAIEPKRYKFNIAGRDEDKDRVRWGFVAQDVDAAMKTAGHEFGGHYVGDDEEQTQSLSYADLTAVLWKAVRELSEQVAELKTQVKP